ncbi:CaiB/BaiF CoA-transferase family protein [Labrenzia sp. PHM005]|uniref:CaiB/BaiF CoA transferase family protein n=1 Tax=Labrenzia sp. PHM005 TaxID=2590016 RepID=UPI00114027F8|nr:CoA transferase [Labrenzia sp. PHM005]QDG74893.1 CoA transferase [Labrenzia sp. PHM005]
MTSTTPKPLDGVRVLDLTRIISGPYCTRLLADCGAEVLKIEPAGGEHMRVKEPLRAGKSTYFGHFNAGKKSIEIDFRSEEDLGAIRKLAASCDVVVENFRPGVVQDLGLDFLTLSAGRKDLVYCSISGFGQTGPRSRHPAYAPILHALSGHDLAAMTYAEDVGKPFRTGIWYADLIGGLFAFSAIQTALIGQLRHGTGQYIDVALMDSMINLLVLEMQEVQTPSSFDRWLATPVKASDGHVIAVPITGRIFERLADLLDHPEWKDDARFNTQLERERNWPVLMALVEDWTKVRTAAECEIALMGAGIPCARYQTVAEAIKDEQVTARELMTDVGTGPEAFKVANLPFLFAGAPLPVGSHVPAVGEHTGAVLDPVRGTAVPGVTTANGAKGSQEASHV